ncbi:MAG: RHS repeat domain-containing protein [Candidatus Methylomirabilales bacterium]
MQLTRGKFIFVVGLILLLGVQATHGQEIRYVYDDLGRLIAVVDPQGGTAVYEYDAVGNILAIRRPQTTGPVVIALVKPPEGPIGGR